LGYRVAWGLDLFRKVAKSTQYTSYQTTTMGASTRFGFALREDLGLQLRYSIYQQKIELPQLLMNCNNYTPDFVTTFPTSPAFGGSQGLNYLVANGGLYNGQPQTNCFADGEASLAVRRELAQGPVITSAVGYDLSYNTLDNNRNPTS